jgi:hypothetical protein
MLGIVGLPLSHYWLVAKVEPFYSLIYCFLWWSYIFFADFVVFKLRGKSLLSDRRWEFVVLWFWSIPAWIIFEVFNRRMENWYYVMAPIDYFTCAIYLIFAFGAVLPGVFETAEIIIGIIEKVSANGKISGPPFVADRRNVMVQMVIGAAMLVLLVIFPRSFFAFAWGFVFFMVDPLCYWLNRKEPNHIGRSLLGQLAAGDNTRFVALLLSGVICGGLWEGWNLGARTKWIYTVPFFDELKLGEMPILGFLGFPPFVLECYAMMNLLAWYRGGRNWELSGAENQRLPGMQWRGIAASAVLVPVVVALGAMAALLSVASIDEPLDRRFGHVLGAQGVAALRERNALRGSQFLKLKTRPPEIDAQLWNRLQRIVRLSELKGIGIRKALCLEKLNILDFDNLAAQEPATLAANLQRIGCAVRIEEVKVWVRAAVNDRAATGTSPAPPGPPLFSQRASGPRTPGW